jgi:hypothetical protein
VESLLQATGALTTIDLQDDRCKNTALHWAGRAKITKLLLLAGADPHIQDSYGRTPLQVLEDFEHKDQITKIILPEAIADGGRTFLLHKARHLSDAAYVVKDTVVAKATAAAPPTLRSRMPTLSLSMLPTLPRIELAPVSGNGETEEEAKEQEKRRAVLRYVLRVEEEEGEGAGNGGSDGMPSEVFYELLKMIKPSYYGCDGRV